MAAAVISSSPTAWQALQTNLAGMEETVISPRMEEVKLNGQDFVTLPNEVVQFIELAQLGWGASIGTGKRLGYWATVELLRDMLTAHANKGVPTRS